MTMLFLWLYLFCVFLKHIFYCIWNKVKCFCLCSCLTAVRCRASLLWWCVRAGSGLCAQSWGKSWRNPLTEQFKYIIHIQYALVFLSYCIFLKHSWVKGNCYSLVSSSEHAGTYSTFRWQVLQIIMLFNVCFLQSALVRHIHCSHECHCQCLPYIRSYYQTKQRYFDCLLKCTEWIHLETDKLYCRAKRGCETSEREIAQTWLNVLVFISAHPSVYVSYNL